MTYTQGGIAGISGVRQSLYQAHDFHCETMPINPLDKGNIYVTFFIV